MLGITYQFNGITLGDLTRDALSGEVFASEAERANGCLISLIETPSGFHSPELRHSEESRQGTHGILDYDTFVGKRAIVFTGQLVAPDRESMVQLVDKFQKAFTTTAVPSKDDGYRELLFTEEDSIAKKVFAKVETMPEYAEELGFPLVRNFMVALKCKEPRKLSQALNTAPEVKADVLGAQIKLPTKLPLQTGWDYVYKKTLVNAGNFAASPTITVYAPCVNPKILNRTYGVFMQFVCTLTDSDTLEIDVLAGTATITRTDGSTEDALLVLTNNSEFFYLLSGENEVVFLEESGVPPVDNPSYCRLLWSDTWL
jgi:hypothetical protein